MRAGGSHLGEVGFERLECSVFGSAQEVGELSLVDTVVIDLLVMEPGRADELMRSESMQEFRVQPRIGGQRPILGKPLGEGARADFQAEALLNVGRNALTCLPVVVAHDGIKDDSEREGFAFGDLRGEDPVAVMAPPELDGLQLLIAPAFAGDAGAPAVKATLALVADELMAGSGHVFLVAQRSVLDKGASRIVQLVGEYDPTDSAAPLPHGFCRGMCGFCVEWCGIREVGYVGTKNAKDPVAYGTPGLGESTCYATRVSASEGSSARKGTQSFLEEVQTALKICHEHDGSSRERIGNREALIPLEEKTRAS